LIGTVTAGWGISAHEENRGMSKVADPIRQKGDPGSWLAGGKASHDVPAQTVLKEAQAADTHHVTAVDVLRFLAVCVYLAFVFLFLAATKKIRPDNPFRSFPRWVIYRLFFRVKYPRVLREFTPENGHCYLATIHHRILSDLESASRISVYEDGVPLPHPHADHLRIREQGQGAFSHWGSAIYLSTSDNSDPRTNGRTYTYKEV
jgi:hypothetical protein